MSPNSHLIKMSGRTMMNLELKDLSESGKMQLHNLGLNRGQRPSIGIPVLCHVCTVDAL